MRLLQPLVAVPLSEMRAPAMRRFWRHHSLTIVTVAALLVTLAWGTWCTWHEWVSNETAGIKHPVFWDHRFWAYWQMQIAMNFAPELMGAIWLILATKRLHERDSGEG